MEEEAKKLLCEETHINKMKDELEKVRQRMNGEREAFHREYAQMTEKINAFQLEDGK